MQPPPPRASPIAGRAPAPADSWPFSCSFAPRAAAADPPDRTRYGFTGTIGYGRATGAASDFLDDTWSADFNVFLEKGRFRGGIGVEFHRFRTVEPVLFPEVSAVPFYLYGAFSPWPEGAGPALPAGPTRADAPARAGDPRPRGARA